MHIIYVCICGPVSFRVKLKLQGSTESYDAEVRLLANKAPSLRMYRRGFTEFTRVVISALGNLHLWGNSKFYLRLRSLPRVNPRSRLQPYSGFDGYNEFG